MHAFLLGTFWGLAVVVAMAAAISPDKDSSTPKATSATDPLSSTSTSTTSTTVTNALGTTLVATEVSSTAVEFTASTSPFSTITPMPATPPLVMTLQGYWDLPSCLRTLVSSQLFNLPASSGGCAMSSACVALSSGVMSGSAPCATNVAAADMVQAVFTKYCEANQKALGLSSLGTCTSLLTTEPSTSLAAPSTPSSMGISMEGLSTTMPFGIDPVTSSPVLSNSLTAGSSSSALSSSLANGPVSSIQGLTSKEKIGVGVGVGLGLGLLFLAVVATAFLLARRRRSRQRHGPYGPVMTAEKRVLEDESPRADHLERLPESSTAPFLPVPAAPILQNRWQPEEPQPHVSRAVDEGVEPASGAAVGSRALFVVNPVIHDMDEMARPPSPISPISGSPAGSRPASLRSYRGHDR